MFLLYFLSKLINSLYEPFVKNTEKEIGHINGTFFMGDLQILVYYVNPLILL